MSWTVLGWALALGVTLARPTLAHEGDAAECARIAQRLAEAPQDPDAWMARAEFARRHLDFESALDDLARAASLAPERADVDRELGRALADVGWLESSLLVLERGLERDPDDREARRLMAVVLRRAGRAEEAPVWLIPPTTGRTSAEDALAVVELARAHRQRQGDDGRFEVLLARAEACAELDGCPAAVLEAVIELECDAGRFEAALRHVDRRLEHATRRESWLARRALLLQRAGRERDASRARREALLAIAGLPAELRGCQAMRELARRLRDEERAMPTEGGVEPTPRSQL